MQRVALAFLASSLLLVACGPITPHASGASAARRANGACVSGSSWHGGENSAMRPGEDCIHCHAIDEGPDFAVAGTIFTNYDEPNDCDGAGGMTIVVTDATAHDYTLHSNAAGNFYLLASQASSLTWPITVTVQDANGTVRAMEEPQSSGACNHCHTSAGAEGAPGRVITP